MLRTIDPIERLLCKNRTEEESFIVFDFLTTLTQAFEHRYFNEIGAYCESQSDCVSDDDFKDEIPF